MLAVENKEVSVIIKLFLAISALPLESLYSVLLVVNFRVNIGNALIVGVDAVVVLFNAIVVV